MFIVQQEKIMTDAEIETMRARKARNVRARDTRKKVVLGGMLLKMVNCGEIQENWLKESIAKHVAERDRKLFSEGYARTLEAIQEVRDGKTTPVTIEELKAIAEAEHETA
jgi:hypothetical protein